MIKQLLFVGLGGGIGSIFRYLVSFLANKFFISTLFPWATFVANISGCFLIGFLAGLLSGHDVWDKHLRLLLLTGFCGGYTTFSAFSLENLRLLENHHYLPFLLYTSTSFIFGIASVALGLWVSKL
ncbi:MAG: fluoride efflux transporter CrcB [Tannerellaceae bacterium]|jgi:CrcB protein|nr:fluoride efflux transporter CrcB [Tannerellaceae bacterium]